MEGFCYGGNMLGNHGDDGDGHDPTPLDHRDRQGCQYLMTVTMVMIMSSATVLGDMCICLVITVTLKMVATMMMIVMTMMMTVLTARLSQTTRSQGWPGDHGAEEDFVFQIVDRPKQNLRK